MGAYVFSADAVNRDFFVKGPGDKCVDKSKSKRPSKFNNPRSFGGCTNNREPLPVSTVGRALCGESCEIHVYLLSSTSTDCGSQIRRRHGSQTGENRVEFWFEMLTELMGGSDGAAIVTTTRIRPVPDFAPNSSVAPFHFTAFEVIRIMVLQLKTCSSISNFRSNFKRACVFLLQPSSSRPSFTESDVPRQHGGSARYSAATAPPIPHKPWAAAPHNQVTPIRVINAEKISTHKREPVKEGLGPIRRDPTQVKCSVVVVGNMPRMYCRGEKFTEGPSTFPLWSIKVLVEEFQTKFQCYVGKGVSEGHGHQKCFVRCLKT